MDLPPYGPIRKLTALVQFQSCKDPNPFPHSKSVAIQVSVEGGRKRRAARNQLCLAADQSLQTVIPAVWGNHRISGCYFGPKCLSDYRTFELMQGWRRYLTTRSYFIALDGAMILVALVVYNLLNPGELLRKVEQEEAKVLTPGGRSDEER
ncbi:MAG: hypothetical protein Q9215_004284 [Flavoplaca cf. flavocitrina]